MNAYKDERLNTAKALVERFEWMRNSGVCSPTTRDLLDDAQCLIAELIDPLFEVEFGGAK